MKISENTNDRTSEDTYARELLTAMDAGSAVIHVRTSEVVRTALATRKSLIVEGNTVKEWDVVNGYRDFDISNMMSGKVTGDGNIDINAAMAIPANSISPRSEGSEQGDSYNVFVFINPQYWLAENPVINHYLQQYSHSLPSTSVRVIMITPDIPLPEGMSDNVMTLRVSPPSIGELRTYLSGVLSGVDDSLHSITDGDSLDRICYAGAGMPREAFELYTSLALVESASNMEDGDVVTADDVINGINKGKTAIVHKNDILELYPSVSMSNVGGMDNLKEWIEKRKVCYSNESAAYGIEPPKGIVLVGVPGSGKSLVAKSVANTFGVPLIRLDFGRVFNSLLGKSEERIRTALRMVEDMAPVVLFADEIDKGLGGIGGSGDSGASSRVLGSFLTWLNDNTKPVFTIVTANNISGLPPEMMRRGRFDAIFSTGFPTPEERMTVLEIHLNKRGWKSSKFPMSEKIKVVEASRGYVPAEIEAAVKDGLINAYSKGEDFTMDHVLGALLDMVPLSKAYGAQIQAMTLWAKQNATPASRAYDNDLSAEYKVTSIAEASARRIRTKPTTKK